MSLWFLSVYPKEDVQSNFLIVTSNLVFIEILWIGQRDDKENNPINL